jgi:hypothetical protein
VDKEAKNERRIFYRKERQDLRKERQKRTPGEKFCELCAFFASFAVHSFL